jgi:hypothetical protein
MALAACIKDMAPLFMSRWITLTDWFACTVSWKIGVLGHSFESYYPAIRYDKTGITERQRKGTAKANAFECAA